MDIGSKAVYPASELSNFSRHPFVIDDVECESMEGWLQSLKFEEQLVQVDVCKLVGFAAKRRGQERNEAWKNAQKLWWRGQEYDRHGQEYQALLDRAFEALTKQNELFRNALLATEDSVLTHSIGNQNPSDTVLTEDEFCFRLMHNRSLLQRGA